MSSLSDAKNLINRFQNVSIIPSPDIQGDSLGASLALFYILKKIKKDVNMVGEKVPERFRFLVEEWSLNQPRELAISINTSGKEIEKLRYEKNEKDLKLHLTLSQGMIKKEDISLFDAPPVEPFSQNEQDEEEDRKQPDLLITVGIKNWGEIQGLPAGRQGLPAGRQGLSLSPEIFYQTPVLNIDNQPANENFGEVNLVEIVSSLSEISTKLIKEIDEGFLDKNVATCLLAGIICFSKNFKNPRVRPRSFETASYLMEKGAEHQKIIQQLYKTKPLSQVKLLGRVLKKLNFDQSRATHSALLSKDDFQETDTTSKDLGFIVQELKNNFNIPCPALSNLLILWESHASENLVKGIFYSSQPGSLKKVLESFPGVSQGNRAIFAIQEKDLSLAQEKLFSVL